MIKMKKLHYYILGIYLLSLSSFLLAEDAIYLWDLGMKINTQSQVNAKANLTETISGNVDKKFAALAKRHVSPKYVNVEFKNNSKQTRVIAPIDFSILNYLDRYNLGNKYFMSGRYVEAIKLFEMVEFNKLDIKQRGHLMQLHADALFNFNPI